MALAVAAAVACSSSDDKKTPDAASTSDAFQSACGHPGDTGNEMMIGKFCQSFGDCPQTAPLCSVIGDPTTHFCTRTCSGSGSGSAQCGTNTTCTCNASNQCGCTPNSCL
jgi:hypothetical protein